MTTVEAKPAVAPGEMLARVRELRPLIEANRRWAHENARMAPAVLEAGREIGLFLIASPVEVGGADVDCAEFCAIFEELGYSDPTIGWHLGNNMSVAVRAAFMAPEQRERIFSGPPGPFGFSGIPGGIAEPVDGGYRLKGRWQFLTGCQDAPWATLFGKVFDGGVPRTVGGAPELRAFIVPAGDFAIERTWDTATAMRGTGSHAVVVPEAFVPEEYSLSSLAPPKRYLESKASHWPFATVGAGGNAPIAIGIARRVVEEVIKSIREQSPRAEYTPYRDRSEIQVSVSNAKAAVTSLSASFQALAREIDEASAQQRLTNDLRAEMWGMFFYALDQCRSVVTDMARVAGSALYSTENAVEMGVRDLNAICASMESMREIQWSAGKVLFGMPPGQPPYFA